MKKLNILFIFILSFVFMPSVVFAKDSVYIESATLDSKSNSTDIVEDVKYDGLSIKFNVKFFDVNDYVKYKVTVNNSSNEDFEIIKNSNFNDSEYISYEYSFENDSNIIKKNSKMTMYITIKYNKEVPSDRFVNNSFSETNNLVISLGNDNNISIKNPKTQNHILIALVLLMLVGTTILLLTPTVDKKYYSLLIAGVLLLPVGVFAIEKLQINVESNVLISNNPKFCYIYGNESYYYEYENGMTWGDYINSDYNKDYFIFTSNGDVQPKAYEDEKGCNFLDTMRFQARGYSSIDFNSEIMPSDDRCYILTIKSCK